MHADHGPGLAARLEHGVPVPAVYRGKPEVVRDLAEGHRLDAPGRVATDLSSGEVGVPQWDEAQRDHASARVAAPLVDHPVVVGPHALETELLVVALRQSLTAETNPGREAQGCLYVVAIHVGQAGLELPRPRDHLVVGDALHLEVIARESDRGVRAHHRIVEVFEKPPAAIGRRRAPRPPPR